MSQDWPSPKRPAQQQPLPTTDGLPPAAGAGGYDRASVDEAFAAFYRHISQLDTSLRALEAVESFRQQAAELRADLRSIRASGWTPYPRGYPALPTDRMPVALPEALPRLAVEVAFLVAVAVVLAVGGFGTAWIIAGMAVAVVLTGVFEWLVTRPQRPTALPARPVVAATPAPIVAVPAVNGAGWAAFAETSIVEGEAEPVPASDATAEIEATDADETNLLRALDPWERGFDGDMTKGD